MAEGQPSDFYSGSQLLLPLAVKVGVPIDQLNFLLGQVIALIIGYGFRKILPASRDSATSRHIAEVVIGGLLTYFCFSYQILHLVAQGALCYLILILAPKQHMHVICMVVILGYLAVLHIYRMTYAYMIWEMDISGPVMISTQKLTSLAFSYHDGTVKKEESLSKDQKEEAIRRLPSILEFSSYILSFHLVLVGPMCLYHDYIAFIEGDNKTREGIVAEMPSDVWLNKTLITLACFFVMMVILPIFPTDIFTEDEFLGYNVVGRMFYMLVSVSLVRYKYYFAWYLGELVNNAAGLAFNGYDQHGNKQWDLVNNVIIWDVEFGNSMRLMVNGWNTKTALWLRRVVYERVSPAYNTWMVYLVTSIWHGFYPGYYLAFFTAALFTLTARSVRRNCRSFFISNTYLAFFYDCITFTFTRFCNVYMAMPFTVLKFVPTLGVYMTLYFWLHILSILGLVILPGKTRQQAQKQT